MKRCIIIVFALFCKATFAYQDNVSLELKNVDLAEAVRVFAKFLKMNVILSPSIEGLVTLQFHDALPRQAWELFLVSNGLAKWQMGNVFFIAPRQELIQRKQEETKWKVISEDAAPLVTRVWQIKYGKADELAKVLREGQSTLLSKRGKVHVDTRANVICVQDLASSIHNVERLIHQLDVSVRQILVKVRLASIDSDYERELGVNFSVKSATSEGMNIFESPRYSIAVAKLADGSLLDVKLSALERAGHAELISTPSLLTANQQSASIEAGEEVPYQEVSESGGTAVTFKKAVLGLKVTPQVLPNNQVLLKLQINQDRPTHRMVQGVPTISTRQMATNVLVRNGQTVVLGGIYETNDEAGEHRLPFISDVPILGSLFKQKHQHKNKRELLVFVTPAMMT